MEGAIERTRSARSWRKAMVMFDECVVCVVVGVGGGVVRFCWVPGLA